MAFISQHHRDRANRLARSWTNQRWTLLALLVLISSALAWPASQLKLDESIESFYSEDDPYRLAYERSKAAFGGDEFVLVGYTAEDPTSEAEIRRIRKFSDQLSSVPGIRPESTQDLARLLRNPRASGLLRIAMRLPSTSRSLIELSRRVLIGDDDQTVAIVLRLKEKGDAEVPRAETYRRIRELANAHQPRAYVAGEPIQVNDMFRYVEKDGRTLGIASTGLLMLIILVLFRNIRWVVLPLLVIQLTLLWTCGILSLSGVKLSMVSTMLQSLVNIIGIATMMHIIVTYRDFRTNNPREPALQQSFVYLCGPIFWTTLTTAIGFGALMTSSITPVSSFALMMVVGTLLVPVTCLLLLPAGVLTGRTQADPRRPLLERPMLAQLKRLGRWTVDHPWPILGITSILTITAASGLSQLKIETDFSKNFREGSPIVEALEFFESNLGGAGSWEVGFSVPKKLEDVDLEKVRELASELKELKLEDGTSLTKVVCLTDGLDLVPKVPIDNGRRRGLFGAIPRFRLATLAEREELLSELQPEMEPSLYNPEVGRMRIVLRALEQQPAEVKLRLISAVEETSRKYFPDAQATGLYVLLAYLISSLLQDQLISFGLATLGVATCMTIAFRSLRLGLISIVPNVLPILLVIGGMGWAGIPINIGTAMIASVSMGLTVDSTIHYLTTYLRAKQEGRQHLEAVQIAHGTVGLALTLANIALVIGFSVLALSNFVPLVYFGILVSVAMLGGLICNLLVLPVLLRGVQSNSPAAEPSTT